ncbi:uncharacterized protein [Macrobrachium rosenbergii]|uniref:uncharacterized protein n=1 Tax=Macrobrachium rosenbergii TaxID=79674 RepID=UPI0034D5AAF8
MGDSDAEWVGVDFEFGQADTTTTTRRPARPRQPRPTFTEKPLPVPAPRPDAPEVEGPPTDLANSGSVTVISSVIGGLLGVVLILLVVYMVVLRRRLNKAKVASTDSQYQLRVEDVAHLTHLDETTNTYVNTTDLQKLLTSVKAKGNAQEKPPPTMPKILHQTPTPYRAAAGNKSLTTQGSTENNGYTSDSDIVVLRAPMPLPHDNDLYDTCTPENNWNSNLYPETEVLYSNLEQTEPFKLSKPPPRRKLEAPAAAPPPPPTKQKDVSGGGHSLEKSEPTSPTVIARPAPPPPKLVKTKSSETIDPPSSKIPLVPGNSKYIPPVAPKPNKSGESTVANLESSDSLAAPLKNSKPMLPPASKPTPPVASKPTPPVMSKPTLPATGKPVPPAAKPAPPTAMKPGVTTKAKGLPPLKMALIPSLNRSSLDNCTTPDTGIIELTPENTPTPDTGSISSKIAFLEGKMKTPILPIRGKP